MTDLILTYPPKPEADASVIKPSKQFTRQVFSMLNALLVFFVTYILLLLGAIVIAILLMLFGYGIVVQQGGFITLVLGLGLAAAGVMLVFFLIKFIFKKSQPVDYSDLIEIKPAQHPHLFNFIENLTKEVNVDFPAHVYLSPEVNAGVFFDSTFWSMFFPVKKNLKIGLGLVNSINQSEFKAVLAHEFGHFSQRSMKFGSYVYNLNKVLYNLLYDNSGFEKALQRFARMHYILRLTMYINIYLIRGIQYILRKVYVLINKNHLKLSREMEFQADAIAAYISGSNQAISLLRRIELGQTCYQSLLNYWDAQLEKNQRADNIYLHHTEILKYFAEEYHLKLDAAGLPLINKRMAVLNNNQVSIDDQWSSHPTDVEREQFLQQLDIHTQTIIQPAWDLFNNVPELQQQMSDKLYATLETDKQLDKVNHTAFKETYETEVNVFAYPKFYKGYYNNRSITQFDLDNVKNEQTTTADDINLLFSDDNCNLPKAITGMYQDIDLLNQVIVNNDIQTFDYKGVKYYEDYAPDIINELKKQAEASIKAMENLDASIYHKFYQLAPVPQRMVLKQYYSNLFAYQPVADKHYECYADAKAKMSPVYQRMSLQDINNTLDAVYATEKELKPLLTELIQDEANLPVINWGQSEALTTYLDKQWDYFPNGKYDNQALGVFSRAMDAYLNTVTGRSYKLKKELLDFQLHLLSSAS